MTKNEMQVFRYGAPFEGNGFIEKSVRVAVDENGSPWWVLADVCEVLEISNPRNVAARLEDDEKGVRLMDTLGGKQELTLVNEAGLYSVILRSDKPEARRFKRWITHVVLPEIRSRGSYGFPDSRIPRSLPEALRLAAELEEQRAFLELKNRSLAPKALAWEATASEGSEMSLQALGKELARFGMGPRKIFEALGGMGVLYRLDGYWVPHQEHIDARRFRVIRVNKVIEGEPRSCMKTLVTPKGRDYVAMLMAGRRAVA
jgi:anti-repressor protein